MLVNLEPGKVSLKAIKCPLFWSRLIGGKRVRFTQMAYHNPRRKRVMDDRWMEPDEM